MAYYKKKPKKQVRAARKMAGKQGGQARWAGMTADERREAMRKVTAASPRTKPRAKSAG